MKHRRPRDGRPMSSTGIRLLAGESVAERRHRFVAFGLIFLVFAIGCYLLCRTVADPRGRAASIAVAEVFMLGSFAVAGFAIRRRLVRGQSGEG